jgi:hypothetical protein
MKTKLTSIAIAGACLVMVAAEKSRLLLVLRGSLALALLALATSRVEAASFAGAQTGPTEWTYTLTYDPEDNYAVCPPPGNVATITLTGLAGVTSATAPTSTDIASATSDPSTIAFFNSVNLAWTAEVLNGGTEVRWTHFGPGTGNWPVTLHVFGFKVFTATPATNGLVDVATDGFSTDVSVTGPCPVQPADDRDFIGTTDGPVLPRSTLAALGPARTWLGLKNSDDVGTKFDLLAEVLVNGTVVSSNQLNNVPGGSSGFNNAVLRTINQSLVDAVAICHGDELGIRLSVRIAVGVTGHRNGTARLWFNDAVANSRFDATIDATPVSLYLLDGFVLGTSPGAGPKKTIDVTVDRLVGGNAFKSFGTWNITF